MTTSDQQTLAQLPLPDLIYRLSEFTPEVFSRTTLGIKSACSKGIDNITVWPTQPHHAASIVGNSAGQLAYDLLEWAEQKDWEMQLEYKGGIWRANLLIPPALGWLTAVGDPMKHPHPFLQAVAGVLLMGIDMKNGGDGFIH